MGLGRIVSFSINIFPIILLPVGILSYFRCKKNRRLDYEMWTLHFMYLVQYTYYTDQPFHTYSKSAEKMQKIFLYEFVITE